MDVRVVEWLGSLRLYLGGIVVEGSIHPVGIPDIEHFGSEGR